MAKKIEVQVIGDSSSLSRALANATSGAGRFGSTLGTLGKTAALAAGAAGIGAVAVTLRQGIREYAEASKVAAQTNAVIKSTGGIANVTAKQVDTLAESLMRKSGVDDEAIKSGENLLLSFTHIRNEAGKGNDIFNQATAAVLDFAVRTGRDVPQAALLLGKALEDPATKVRALARAGIVFTDAQKKMIAEMQRSGDLMGAQKMILSELEKRYGGAAEAAGSTLGGQLNILRESFNNFAGDLVARAVPALQRFADFLNTVMAAEGFKAKLKIVWEGIETVASELATKIGDALSKVDWSATAKAIATAWRSAIQAAYIDSEPAVREAANNLVNKINSSINDANWDQIGFTMGTSLREQITRSMSENAATTKSLSDRIVENIRTSLSKVPGLGVLMRIPTGTLSASFSAALQTAVGFFSGLTGITRSSIANFQQTMRQGMLNGMRAVADAAAVAFGFAARIGSQIVQGVLAGLGNLYGAVKSKIESTLSSVLSGIDIPGFSPPHAAAAKAIGEPLGKGAIDGWIKSSAPLPEKMAASVRAAIERARAAIESARDRLGTAFDGLAARILRAFDAETGAMQTATEKRITEIEQRRQMEDLLNAQAQAQMRLTEAIKEGDAAAIAAAERDLARAGEDIALVDMRKQAEQERIQLDSQNEERRLALEKRLNQLKAHFEREGATTKQAMAAIAKIMRSFEIDFADAGALLGTAFAKALQKAISATAAAATGVNAAVPGAPSGFSSAPTLAAAGGGGTTVVNNFNAPVWSERELDSLITSSIARTRNSGGLGPL